MIPLIIGAIEAGEMIAGAAEVGGIAAEGGAIAAEGGAMAAEGGAIAGEEAEAGVAAKRGGGIINKLIGAEEIGEIGKTVRSIFGKNKDDKADNTESVEKETSSGTYAGSTSTSASENFDDVNRNISKQESLLTKGFWFGRNQKPDPRDVEQAMQRNTMALIVSRLTLIDNKLSRLDNHMLGIKKVLSDHLTLERDRIAEQEISSQEETLKYSTKDSYPWLAKAKGLNDKSGGSILPFLTVALMPTILDWYNKFAKWTWDGTQRLAAGLLVASKTLTRSLEGLSQWASRTGSTLLAKLQPFEGSVTKISQVGEEEEYLRSMFDSFYKQSRGEFGQGTKQSLKSAQRALLKYVVSKDPKKFNESFKNMFSNKQAYESGKPIAMAQDEVVTREADSLGKMLAKGAGRGAMKMSSKAAKALSYLVPIRGILQGIAKYAKFLMFLDPLIALLKVGIGIGSWNEVEKAFVRALGAFIGAELGAAGGAAAGGALFGALGTVIPGVGNLVGAAVGSVVGGLIGGFGGASVGEYLATKIWQIITGEKTVVDVASDVASDALNQAKIAAGLITGTTPVTAGNIATAGGFNPATAGDKKNTVGGGGGQTEIADSSYDIVLGYGKFGKIQDMFPGKKLTQLKVSEVFDFQKNVLIPNSRGKLPHGADSGLGAYSINSATLQTIMDNGIISPNDTFDKTTQDKAAKWLYEHNQKNHKLQNTWNFFRKHPDASGMSFEQAKSSIVHDEGTDRNVRPDKSEKGSSPPYSSKTMESSSGSMRSTMPMRGVKLNQSQQYGIPSPFASTSYEDRVSVFFNANEPAMGVGMG